MEKQIVSGALTLARAEAKITHARRSRTNRASPPLSSARSPTDQSVVDMIVQNISDDGSVTAITFTVPDGEYDKAIATLKAAGDRFEYARITGSKGGAKVSVVGVGMRSHAGVASSMFKALADKGINIKLITTSEIKTSVLIDDQYAELAVRALHTYYGLDKPDAWRRRRNFGELAGATRGDLRSSRSMRGGGATPPQKRMATAIRRPACVAPAIARGHGRAFGLAGPPRQNRRADRRQNRMHADVCSFYVLRDDGALELFAT